MYAQQTEVYAETNGVYADERPIKKIWTFEYVGVNIDFKYLSIVEDLTLNVTGMVSTPI